MFFFISKIFTFLLNPLFWVFSFLLMALFFKKLATKRKVLILGIVLFYFFSNEFILEEVNRVWEIPATHYKDLETYDAGIVLGGILNYDAQFGRIQFERGADRLSQAIELYKIGSIKKIFFVGGSGSIEFAHMKEGALVKRYLQILGIPNEDIWIENESRNTRENAVNAKEFLVKNNSDSSRFLLITSGRHMRRALNCFSVVGLEVVPYSVDRAASPVRRYSLDHLFIPNINALMLWNAVIHEWIGMIVYKINGYA